MEGTIIEYIRDYGGQDFTERPFCDVDALVLSQFCYLKFDRIVPGPDENRDIALQDLPESPDYESLFSDIRYEKSNRPLLRELLQSKRFGGMRLRGYVNLVETTPQVQFSAITFFPEGADMFVAFRGTDENMVGWKEDFNMTFMDEVPGQHLSVEYLEKAATWSKESFLVGGHSKGGNLSVYSAMNCSPETRQRIRNIYSMDGPGFRDEVLEGSAYLEIRDRIVKILPESSMVGMLMESDSNYSVIKSNSFGLTQHNPYTWMVEGTDFVRREKVDSRVLALDDAVNDWILAQDNESRESFVDAVYGIFSSCDADTLIDFNASKYRNMSQVLSSLRGLDEQTVTLLRRIIKNLMELSGAYMKTELSDEAATAREDLKRGVERRKEEVIRGAERRKEEVIREAERIREERSEKSERKKEERAEKAKRKTKRKAKGDATESGAEQSGTEESAGPEKQ